MKTHALTWILASLVFSQEWIAAPRSVEAAGPAATTPYAWYRADAGVKTAGSGDTTVLIWEDQSGHGRHLTAFGKPKLTRNGPKGVPSVGFSGAGDYFEGTVENWGTAAPGTVFAAWKWGGGSAGACYLYDGGSIDKGRQGLSREGGETSGIAVGALGPGNNVVPFQFPDADTWNVSAVTYLGEDTIRINGADVASGDLHSDPGMTGILVGAFVITSRNRWKGEISELIVYEGELPAAEKDQLERYLMAKAGVSRAAPRAEVVVGTDEHTLIHKEGAVDIGSRLELMVDDYLIDRMTGARLVLHQPTMREVAIVHNAPWEGNNCGYHTVFRDDDRYRMYYMCAHNNERSTDPPTLPIVAAYAESLDGVHWRKPSLGLFEFSGSRENNIIWTNPGAVGFCPFKDPNPACTPDARYKGFCLYEGGPGLLPIKSPDGIHFSLMQKEPVITDGAFDSQNLAFWDSARGEYRAYWRHFRNGVRDIKTATSKDFVHWTEPVWLQYPGAPNEHLYTNQIGAYYRAPHLFVGFPTRYVDRGWQESLEFLPLLEARRERAKMSPRFGSAITDGLFMSSRDGVTFRRWREAFIRPGRQETGNWIYGDQYQNWGLVETKTDVPGVPAELSFYSIEGCWRGRANQLRRYTIRIDGFVSVQAPMKGGEFVTRPLTFSGHQLVLNYSTSAAGAIRVEIQDEKGQPIPGFRLRDCPVIFGDAIERVVRWNKNDNVDALAGKPVRLRFSLKDADLFSIRFRD